MRWMMEPTLAVFAAILKDPSQRRISRADGGPGTRPWAQLSGTGQLLVLQTHCHPLQVTGADWGPESPETDLNWGPLDAGHDSTQLPGREDLSECGHLKPR